jgi:hypothetical protein
MVTKTPFKVIHISKTQFLEPTLVGFGRSIYDVGRWIKSGSKNLEKKKLEIFEVDFCNAVGTRNSSFQSLDLFSEGRPITIQVLFFFLVNSIFSLLGREKKKFSKYLNSRG